MALCHRDPMDPAHVKRVTNAIGCATAWRATCQPRRNPKTGGLAVRVSLRGRTAWLSCERGRGELAHATYDADGREVAPPTNLDYYLRPRLTTQAQVIACHLLDQPWERRRR